jgi:hypothetical protein
MTYDSSWLDRTSAWWAKADRAQHHLRLLDRLVAEFRASEPYTVVPRPTDTPGRTEYRLHIYKPVPPEISTTIGDILHNLRSALDSLAYEMALRGRDRPMTKKQERGCVFPVRETPERFDEFFDGAPSMRATGSALRCMKTEPGLPSSRSSPSASMRKRFSLAWRSPTPISRSTAGASCTG